MVVSTDHTVGAGRLTVVAYDRQRNCSRQYLILSNGNFLTIVRHETAAETGTNLAQLVTPDSTGKGAAWIQSWASGAVCAKGLGIAWHSAVDLVDPVRHECLVS